ncbi:MAG TPA: hypothetical protein VNA19_14985 [Pyrinomonadaceae bacterium]|jgi:hypothetical protein|nr:hypothetical protein [Pyrinomonadaceae bacterium]
MAKDFKCAVCRKSSERLHMRDSDGKWVCAQCIPEREVDACEGLRQRLGLARSRATAQARKKAA